jgi:16S rRNA (guanine(527)-N(7))-methyltransferase RsmG
VNSANELNRLIEKSGILMGSAISSQLQRYLELLEKWNARINLTSSTEWSSIKPLFQEGIWASKIYREGSSVHLDIGSGAGFPAILLKILKPDIRLDMVESREKRCVFLETLIDALKIEAASVHCMRLSEYLKKSDKMWDCVSWKALKLGCGDLKELLLHSHQLTQFWMFHGKQLPIKELEYINEGFRLKYSEKFDGEKAWMLSIYCPRNAFHVKQFPANTDT